MTMMVVATVVVTVVATVAVIALGVIVFTVVISIVGGRGEAQDDADRSKDGSCFAREEVGFAAVILSEAEDCEAQG